MHSYLHDVSLVVLELELEAKLELAQTPFRGLTLSWVQSGTSVIALALTLAFASIHFTATLHYDRQFQISLS